MKSVIISLFLSVNSFAQDWHNHMDDQAKLVANIINQESWESIYQFAHNELKIPKEKLLDISKTIEFQNKSSLTAVDLFFHRLCDSVYLDFPYRKSGNLTNDLYFVPPPDTSKIGIFLRGLNGKSLYPEFAEILQIEEKVLLPQLMEYLKNDAATRLCVRPFEWDEAPYYLSISDVAMEIIEVITYCDFFDNASFSNKLYSNLNQDERKEIFEDIDEWIDKTRGLSGSSKVVFFLDSICKLGHSYSFTCHNLLFARDTVTAKRMYRKFYDTLSMPCRKEWEIGKILLSLGDRTVIEDCMNTSINYRCMDDSGIKCITIFLESEEAYYRDELFAEIISTEPNSAYRKSGTGPGYIWHEIFGEIGDYDKYKLPKTLVALMDIRIDFTEIRGYSTHKWKKKYPEEILSSYRICDLALLKYNETIEAIDISNWNDIMERNKAIELIRLKYEN